MTDSLDLFSRSRAYMEALENKNRLRTQNQLPAAAEPTNHAPPPSPTPSSASRELPRPPVTASTRAFDSSRLHIPPTAYARGHVPQQQRPPTSHAPNVAPNLAYLSLYTPRIYAEPLDRISREMVFDRVYLLLRDTLAESWNKEALCHLTRRMADEIIRRGQAGAFGPNGLSSLLQIFMCISHEGVYHCMCLAVNPGFGDVQVLIKGELCEQEGQDPMLDGAVLALCREGFDRRAAKIHEDFSAKRR